MNKNSEKKYSSTQSDLDAALRRFRQTWSVSDYLNLRHRFPDHKVDVTWIMTTLWQMENFDSLEKYNIDFQMFGGAALGEIHHTNELCLKLLELINERQNMEKSGATHLQSNGKAISDSTLRFVAGILLDGCLRNPTDEISADFVFLIKQLLGINQAASIKKVATHRKKQRAIDYAVVKRFVGKEVSFSEIAEVLQVNKSTVSRWFQQDDFETSVQIGLEVLERKRKSDGAEK